MATYHFYDLNFDNTIKMSESDDFFWAMATNWPMRISVDGMAGNDTLAFDLKRGDISNLSIKISGSTTQVAGQLVSSFTMYGGLTVETRQYIDYLLKDIETLRFRGEGGGFDPIDLVEIDSITTDGFLQTKFGLTIGVAHDWVISHLHQPSEIYAVCSENGISSSMLAEIVQYGVSDVVITGAMVNDWMVAHHQPVLL